MDHNQIAYFLDIAQTGNMSRSAERLHVAQPSISRSMHRLERELGASLFMRTPKGMELSEQGHALAKRLAPVAAELESIEGMFAAEQAASHRVRISVAAASEVASTAIAEWMAANPDCRVSLAQGAAEHEDSCDICIAANPLPLAVRYRCFSEQIMLASAEDTQLEGKAVRFTQLKGRDFISLPPAYGFSATVGAMCEQIGFRPQTVFESNNPSVVRKMIALGLGVGFWPEKSWGRPQGAAIKLLPLEGAPTRDVYVSLAAASAANRVVLSCYEQLCASFAIAFA